ncbi:MAG TPA: FMN-binding protein [Acidimicrobiales bacterium]|nr:FMN-binding protein [Acidimicrobiales bacterium]
MVTYMYGSLSVRITVSARKVTKVAIASLTDTGDFRSESIDEQALPILEQEALTAQSADIQGVSGASYTSAGFASSLQSALGKAGL